MNKELKNKLSKLPDNSNPYKVPEGYFDSFAERVLDNTNNQKESKRNNITIMRILKPALGLIASFIVIFLIIFLPSKIINPTQTQKLSEIEDTELLNYLYINDHVVVTAFEDENQTDYDEKIVETVLLASVSDFELLNY